MNPNTLICQTTGRILVGQVMRAAHARAAFQTANNGETSYRASLATALRLFWSIAHSYAAAWLLEHGAAVSPLPYMGGRRADGVMNERVL